jgi:ribosomal protein L11 methyltransferase
VIRLAVRCRPDLADRVLAELVQLAPGGVEEERGSDYVEYAIYGAEGELPALPDLEAATAGGLIEVAAGEVPDDWADRWRDFHRPILVGDRLWIRPSWERPRDRAIDVVIDPGHAFGTGAHPTTRLCLELMCELADRGEASRALADLGTGSGVLAIAAAKLGWHPVIAADYERPSLEAARANADANGVEVELRRLNLRSEAPPRAETVVANLTAPALAAIAQRWAAAPEPDRPGRLVCSGLLTAEADEVAAGLGAAGFLEIERRSDGDWAALLLRAASRDHLRDDG